MPEVINEAKATENLQGNDALAADAYKDIADFPNYKNQMGPKSTELPPGFPDPKIDLISNEKADLKSASEQEKTGTPRGNDQEMPTRGNGG